MALNSEDILCCNVSEYTNQFPAQFYINIRPEFHRTGLRALLIDTTFDKLYAEKVPGV